MRHIFYRKIIKKYLKDCKTVLDVGCGGNQFVEAAKDFDKDIIGIDIDDFGDYRKWDKEMDAVVSFHLIEHIDQFEYMKFVRKYAKKKIIICTDLPTKSFWNDPSHIRPYTPEAINRLMKLYGFKPIGSWGRFGSFYVVGVRSD